MDPKRVVITGMGIISSVGKDLDTYWNNLKNGVCGIDYVEEFKDMPVTFAGKVKDFDPEQYGMDKPFVRKQDHFTQYAIAAAWQAMQQSGLCSEGEGANIDPYRLGVYVGSGIGGFEVQYRETQKMLEDPTGKWISPLFIATMISNIAAGHVAIKHHAEGPCLDIVTACATSSHCIGEAFRAVRHGYADAIIAGGSEHASIPMGVAGFFNAKALTRATDPQYASLPFNANRQGFVMGDGAAVLILESLEHAQERGATIYGEIVGYGNTCDAFHATAPRPDGSTQAQSIKDALAEAGFDAAKSMTGHMFGAAGGAEAIATIMALKEGICPPTINLDTPDPECDLDYTPNVAVKAPLTLGLSNSFGFGGHNACLAFRPFKG